MSRKQIISFVILGFCLTFLVSSFPILADRYVLSNMDTATLYNEKELNSFLREEQTKGVFIGLHGYDHVCPFCGSTTHELSCPNAIIPLGKVNRRIIEGLNIFNECGLRVDWYAFPGEAYDQRCIDILKAHGFNMIPYEMGGETREMPVDRSMLNFTLYPYPLKEYTWNWRYGVSPQTFNSSLEVVKQDNPIQLLIHIQDYNIQTKNFLEYAVSKCGTTIIRCDDITSNWDLSNTKELCKFAEHYNVTLLLAVIPAFKRLSPSSLSAYTSLTWYVFLASFVFPVAVMVPWAIWFKYKRRIEPLSGNPHFPSVSMILPGYNEEKIIGKAIEQVLCQDYEGSVEVVVVNDGSTDRTEDIVKQYAAKHPNIKLITHKENKGKPEALNTGFANATGEISIFQDTDSVIAPNLVSKMVPHFKDPEVGMVAGMIVIENEHNLLTRLQQIEYLYSQTVVRFCQAAHQNVLICPGAATAVRTRIAQQIPSTDRTITEDADFTFSVWKAGWKISQEPEAISYTEAPEKLDSFFDQRKRWLYGVLQTIAIHKWALRKNNLWVIWAWLGYIICPLSVFSLMSMPIFYLLSGISFLWFLTVYSLLSLAIFMSAQVIGVALYAGERKVKLLILLPIYIIYQLLLQILLVYLVFAYVTKIGINVRYGGKTIHAVRLKGMFG